jgi:hypothetical protein
MADEKDPAQRRLFRVFVSAFSGALLGLFLSELNTPPQQSINSISPEKESAEEKTERKTFTPLVSQVPPPPANSEQPCKDGQHKMPWWKIALDVLMVIFTGGAFAAAAVYAGISYKQWQSQIEAMKIDQRAWVTVSDITQERQGDALAVRIAFKNTGKTPAKFFTVKGIAEPAPHGSKPVVSEKSLPGIGVIAPDAVFHSNVNVPGTYDWKESELLIHGTLTYESVFHGQHWTKFCYRLLVNDKSNPVGFSPCDSGNDVDQSQP